MLENEVNKIIAEFMKWEEYPPNNKVSGYSAKVKDGGYIVDLPTKSLDALIPVWEKLGMYPNFLPSLDGGYPEFCVQFYTIGGSNHPQFFGSDLQLTAAGATAKVILKLKEE